MPLREMTLSELGPAYLSPYLEPVSKLGAQRPVAGGVRVKRPSSASGGMHAPAHRAAPSMRPASAKQPHRAPPPPPTAPMRPSWDPSTKTFYGGVSGMPPQDSADAALAAARAAMAQAQSLPPAGSTYADASAITRARDAAREQKKLADHREGTQRALLERLLRSEKKYEWQQKQLQRVSTHLAQVRSRLATVASERDAALDAARIAAEECDSLRSENAQLRAALYHGGGKKNKGRTRERTTRGKKIGRRL